MYILIYMHSLHSSLIGACNNRVWTFVRVATIGSKRKLVEKDTCQYVPLIVNLASFMQNEDICTEVQLYNMYVWHALPINYCNHVFCATPDIKNT